MRLLDTHCHIDLYPDYRKVLDEVEHERIATIAVTNSPTVFRRSAEVASNAKHVRTAIGLHPELAAQRAHEVGMLIEMLGESRFVGEVGLDFVTNDAGEREVQRKVFGAILHACSGYGNKVLTIHSRRAAREVVEMIGNGFPGVAILHWYTGSISVLEKALKNGCYFSVNPAMTRSEAGRNIIQAIPQDKLLTESDGPFASIDDRPTVPADVGMVVSYVARMWDVPASDAADRIFQNFRHIVSQTFRSDTAR